MTMLLVNLFSVFGGDLDHVADTGSF